MINTTLCYIEQDGKYLLLHRVKKKNDINKDKWIGIGGKFEEKESPEDCIRREVMEETGLTLVHPKAKSRNATKGRWNGSRKKMWCDSPTGTATSYSSPCWNAASRSSR